MNDFMSDLLQRVSTLEQRLADPGASLQPLLDSQLSAAEALRQVQTDVVGLQTQVDGVLDPTTTDEADEAEPFPRGHFAAPVASPAQPWEILFSSDMLDNLEIIEQHALLNGNIHPDTLDHAPVQGDLIVGSEGAPGASLWEALPIGDAYNVLYVDPNGGAAMPAWGKLEDLLAQAGIAFGGVYKRHYKGTNNPVDEILDNSDWRSSDLAVWLRMREPGAPMDGDLFKLLTLPWGPMPMPGAVARLWPYEGITTGSGNVHVLAAMTAPLAPDVTAEIFADDTTGALTLRWTNADPHAYLGPWGPGLAPNVGPPADVVLGSDGSYYRFLGPNNTDPTLGAGDWMLFVMPEVYLHFRIMEFLPAIDTVVGHYIGVGNAS
jgi:hypothetical protein